MIRALLLAVALVCVPYSFAAAQNLCAPRTDALAGLSDEYNESVIASAISTGGHLVEVTATPDGSGWTILVTAPSGVSCIKGTGTEWKTHKPTAEGNPA